VRCDSDRLEQVFTARFDVRSQADGAVEVRLEGIRGGKLPLPVDAVLEQLGVASQPWANALREAVERLRKGMRIGPEIALDEVNGSRQLTLLNVTCEADRLEITARTDRRHNRE